MKSLNEIIAQFPEVGKVGEIIPLTAGLINRGNNSFDSRFD